MAIPRPANPTLRNLGTFAFAVGGVAALAGFFVPKRHFNSALDLALWIVVIAAGEVGGRLWKASRAKNEQQRDTDHASAPHRPDSN